MKPRRSALRWALPSLAVASAILAALYVFDFVRERKAQDRAVEAAVATVQAVGALAVMAATIILARLTADYVEETRRIADLTRQQELWRRNLQAADVLADCLEHIRWETSEKFKAPAILTPNDVRGLCRTWQKAWRLNRALISDAELRAEAEKFEELTREARELTGATKERATEYAHKLGLAAEPLIDEFDRYRSTLPEVLG